MLGGKWHFKYLTCTNLVLKDFSCFMYFIFFCFVFNIEEHSLAVFMNAFFSYFIYYQYFFANQWPFANTDKWDVAVEVSETVFCKPWTMTSFSCVIFSDESTFPQNVFIWYKKYPIKNQHESILKIIETNRETNQQRVHWKYSETNCLLMVAIVNLVLLLVMIYCLRPELALTIN